MTHPLANRWPSSLIRKCLLPPSFLIHKPQSHGINNSRSVFIPCHYSKFGKPSTYTANANHLCSAPHGPISVTYFISPTPCYAISLVDPNWLWLALNEGEIVFGYPADVKGCSAHKTRYSTGFWCCSICVRPECHEIWPPHLCIVLRIRGTTPLLLNCFVSCTGRNLISCKLCVRS